MIISKITKGYMQNFLLTENEAHFAMLIAAGASQGEAYCTAINNTYSENVANVRATEMMKSKAGIRDLIDSLTNVTMKGAKKDEELPDIKGRKKKKENVLDLRDKDSIIEALAEQYDKALDPKVKTDIAMKAADLQRMKNDETKNEEQLRHFFLPLRCKDCSLYIEESKKHINDNLK